MSDLVIRSTRVITPSGVCPATIHVHAGRIARVSYVDDLPVHANLDDAGDLVVMPGLVDTHVHVNDPGRADWEGFETATAAAAAGGITTIVDMPLNSVPATTSLAGLHAKRRAALGRTHVDVAFWGGVVPGNASELEPLANAGVAGFKAFLVPSGVEEFPAVGEGELRRCLPFLGERGLPLLVHAESPRAIERAASVLDSGDPVRYSTWLAARPAGAELEAVALLVQLCREFRARIHVVHVSALPAVEAIQAARQEGLPISAETCPHYLTFAAEDVPDGATLFKCAPPIREAVHREALWRAVADGRIDLVATDHSPCPPSMKCLDTGDFVRAWGGVASLELSLPATWTGGASRGLTFERLAGILSTAPARLAGLSSRKGSLDAGFDADIVVWDPDAAFTVDARTLAQRHKVTPYDCMPLLGVVHRTYLRGEVIYRRGSSRLAAPLLGQLLDGQHP